MSSVERDDTKTLTRFYLPLLAVAGVGLVMLYAVFLLAGIGSGYYFIEWALMMGLLLFCARAVLADYGRWVRLGFFLFFAAAVPGAIIVAGVTLKSLPITLHAFILFGLCMFGWKLLEPVVEQCTGHTGRALVKRKKIVFVPTFPFVDIYETTEPGGLAFSGDALVALVVFGTLIFALGDFLRLSQGYTGIMSAMPFALGFYAIAGGLISLSKLVQRVQETPGSVRLEGGFLRSWAGAMLAVLAVSALLAWFLPKSPVIGTGSWMAGGVNNQAQRYKDRFNLPESKTTYDFSRNPQGRAPFGGRGPSDAPGEGKVPGSSKRAVGPDPRPTKNPKETALDLAYKAATSFEGNQPERQAGGQGKGQSGGDSGQNNSGGKTPGKGDQSKNNDKSGGSGGSGNDGGSGKSDKSDQSGKSDQDGKDGSSPQQPENGQSDNKQNQLAQALKNRPDRLLKLLLFLLLALLAAFALALLLFRVLRKYIWYQLANLFRQLWGWACERWGRMLGPYRERSRQARRERRILQIMEGLQPFTDPFTNTAAKTPDDVARAAYAALLAHLWLLGYERRESETDFDFAARLARQAKLDERAIMELTMGCVRSEFSPTPLTAAELAQVQRAYSQLIDSINARIPKDARLEKMDAYRRLLAERQYVREEELKKMEAPGAQETAA
ncbi:MAG: DUF4129 domain-containing protein [Armatimonadota bacterium]